MRTATLIRPYLSSTLRALLSEVPSNYEADRTTPASFVSIAAPAQRGAEPDAPLPRTHGDGNDSEYEDEGVNDVNEGVVDGSDHDDEQRTNGSSRRTGRKRDGFTGAVRTSWSVVDHVRFLTYIARARELYAKRSDVLKAPGSDAYKEFMQWFGGLGSLRFVRTDQVRASNTTLT